MADTYLSKIEESINACIVKNASGKSKEKLNNQCFGTLPFYTHNENDFIVGCL